MYINLNLNNPFKNISFGHVNDRDQYLARNFSVSDDNDYYTGTHYTNANIKKMGQSKKYKLGKATEKYGEYLFYRSCKRKKRYESYSIARRTANKMHRIYPEKDYGVYCCKFCEGWHVFTKKKSKASRLNTNSEPSFNSFA